MSLQIVSSIKFEDDGKLTSSSASAIVISRAKQVAFLFTTPETQLI